ncbi:hypothetical protein N3K59_06075 [Acinetobacter baumannii]|nr:hypothetical protein [Acinetobacter baumannii]MCA4215527.1 hypothetical protein [Acinetobacter baumannii]MCL8297668.1 hypothetical protein [Acinetobacter baumannii]MCO0803206.1 hypothetical protein [Acinetobacter baumannii]MCO4227975.1 hypothetical protein [Acinetobacter baumannii]MCO4249190.1 hypothetical protein [Acinetobacter baumannii]
MLLKLLGIILALLGCISLYLSHPNQNLLQTNLSKTFIYLGTTILFASLIILLFSIPKLVAVLIWLAVITLVWSFIPFLNLFKRNNAQ